MASTTSTPEVTIHWLDSSRAERHLWILEELGIPYKTKAYKRVQGLAPDSLKAIHPLGKSPLITIKEADGTERVLAESGHMTEYLGVNFGGVEKGLWDPASWDQKYWLHYTEGSFMLFPSIEIVLSRTAAHAPFLIKPLLNMVFGKIRALYLDPNARLAQKYLEETLRKNGGYLVGGKFSLADALLGWSVMLAMERCAWEKKGEVWEWIEKLREREAFKKAKAKEAELNKEVGKE